MTQPLFPLLPSPFQDLSAAFGAPSLSIAMICFLLLIAGLKCSFHNSSSESSFSFLQPHEYRGELKYCQVFFVLVVLAHLFLTEFKKSLFSSQFFLDIW
jgi:hypothetical protein